MKRLLFLGILLLSIQAHALTIGIARNFPPFSVSTGPNQFSGFEVELANTICQRIQEKCTFKPLLVGTIPNQLLTQSIDLGMATLLIPSNPSGGYIFSIPYFPSSMQFLVKKSSNIKTSADITYKTIGIRNFYGMKAFETFISKLYNGHVLVKEFSSMDDLLDALQNNNLHTVLASANAVQYWAANNPDQFRVIGDKINYGNGYGFMANVGQEALIAKINGVLEAMMTDGSYATIYSHYFMQ